MIEQEDRTQTAAVWMDRAGWASGWLAIVAAAAWLAALSLVWALVLALLTAGWTAHSVYRRRRAGVLVGGLLLGAVVVAGATELRLADVAGRWPDVREEIRDRAAADLRDELDGLVDRGGAAVEGVVAAYERVSADRRRLFEDLARTLERSGVTAISVHARDGTPIAWAGTHRGAVPEAVRRGMQAFVYDEGALFGHLYFTRPLPDGRTAVAAVLLQSDVTLEGAPAVAERFHARHGLRPVFSTPDQARGEVVWDWTANGRILSVTFAPVTEEEWRARTVRTGRRLAGTFAAGAGAILLLIGFRRRWRVPALPLMALGGALLIAPLGEILGTRGAFSPLSFLLPLPGNLTLGDLLVITTVGGVAAASVRPGNEPPGTIEFMARVALVAAWAPIALFLLLESAAEELLIRPPAGSLTVLVTGILLFGILAALAFTPAPGRPRGSPIVWGAMGMVTAAGLGTLTVAAWNPDGGIPLIAAAAWAVPFALLCLAPRPGWPAGRRRLFGWMGAAWIAASAVAPMLYTAHLDARTAAAERELERLGTEADPFLDFLLRQYGSEVERLADEGEEGVRMLFRAWVASGMSEAGYEARMTLWERSEVEAELRFTDAPLLTDQVMQLAARAVEEGARATERFTDVESLHYLLVVPLDDERAVSVSVPPQRRLARPALLSAFLDPARAGDPEGPYGPLRLIPTLDHSPGTAQVQWRRTDAGWRTETDVPFPTEVMHAHLEVRTASALLLAARGFLLLALSLAIFLGVGGAGALVRGGPLHLRPFRGWLTSFRGRLTLALFAFFLLPMAGFGAVAYEALSREVHRAASVLAARSLEQAAPDAPVTPLPELGERIDSELLLYRRGVLVEAASPEAVDLGLYPTWISPGIYLRFIDGDEVEAVDETRLAGRDFLTAYRVSGPAEVLAAPTPLAMGEMARRQQEFADLLLFFGLVGALFSVTLALLVGRMLSRPIERLSRAATAVGRGDLEVRLPEGGRDEFGRLQEAFNLMVRRLRRGRRALLREKQRTEAIVEAAATGVLALDARGRVAAVNPEAAAILGAPVTRGRPLPRRNPLLREVSGHIDRFLKARSAEDGSEIELEGRTVKIQLRRLPSVGRPGGVVVALEDITSEIRSARVLAWGEMAQQIAHEIKNPLTPIKLSVQHLRRAYRDPRRDYEQVLEQNVTAVLREIDRLSEIAGSFARFGSPGLPTAGLESVSIQRVVEEVTALFLAGGEPVEYRTEVEATLPPVAARTGEMKEVLVNLLENAREAVGRGGTVDVHAFREGGEVVLEVRDDGPGIPEEVLPRIFQPHFSTRSSGTGLGLAIVRRLVESWGGTVEAASTEGLGATIIVKVPAAPPETS